jgi:hypothetical protein
VDVSTPIRHLGWLVALLIAIAAAASLPGIAGGHPLAPLDPDHDQILTQDDNCPNRFNPRQDDTDADTQPTAFVNGAPAGTPATPLAPAPNTGGDACDTDDDADAVPDALDNCRRDANPDQKNADADAFGDVCDPDDDEDGIDDPGDNCAFVANQDQLDTDKDGLGDDCDPDAPKRPAGFDARDKRAPRLTIRFARSHGLAEVQSGLAVPVTCSERCRLSARLEVDGASARRARLGGRSAKSVVLARGSAEIEGRGRTYVFVRFTKGTLSRLRRAGTVRPMLVVVARDPSRNRRTWRHRLTLHR